MFYIFVLCFVYLCCVLYVCVVFCMFVLCFVCLCCVLYVCVVFCMFVLCFVLVGHRKQCAVSKLLVYLQYRKFRKVTKCSFLKTFNLVPLKVSVEAKHNTLIFIS